MNIYEGFPKSLHPKIERIAMDTDIIIAQKCQALVEIWPLITYEQMALIVGSDVSSIFYLITKKNAA